MTHTTLMTFASSASQTLYTPAGSPAGNVLALPGLDAANTAARITNPGSGSVWLNFGTGQYLPAGPDVKGSFIVPPGASVLVPSAADAATNVGMASHGAASVTFERGTIGTASYYDSRALAAQV